jgi:predicted dehydrogenase
VDLTGIKKVYDDYNEMLEKEKFDIVIFCPENSKHGEVAYALAKRRINMITEKPMAASFSEARKMAQAARFYNVKLMVNWPTTWAASIRKAKELVENGEIGDIWQIKWRNLPSLGPLSHDEQEISDLEKSLEWWYQSKAGGGALLDYCCYGANLSRWFFKEKAIGAFGLKANFTSHFGEVEDNAVIVARFPRGMAILEASWSTINNGGKEEGLKIFGTKGTITIIDRNTLYVYKKYASSEPDKIYDNLSLPEDDNTPAKHFINHLEKNIPLHSTLDPEINLDAMAILDAGIRSSKSGKMEFVKDITWN